MTTVATPLPIRFVSARHSLMNLSIPTRIASAWIGMSGMIVSVAASVSQTNHYEQNTAEVKSGNELGEIAQRPKAVGTDGKCHSAKRSEGCKLDDDSDDAKEHLARGVDGAVHALADFP